ncbi:MAG TPA: class I SAM-dependent methyltransferase [Pyrinomonadaceae bacterium]|nr:class I SAM-dependent methyltransferase [Pyrinomonadaceae bacterium]
MTTNNSSRQRQAHRALERQLDYQQKKAVAVAGREADLMAAMKQSSERVRGLLEKYRPIDSDASVIEVGSGAHGLIFFFGSKRAIGLDPLAVDYRRLFPTWQKLVPTVAAFGEQAPFRDESFDIVLCDNVVDHAEEPLGIVRELVRILRPGGLLYFTVNIHHPLYFVAARAHSTWNALGVSYEIGPFADHTTHLTLARAQVLFADLPVSILYERSNVSETKARAKKMPARHLGDSLKRLFFKNALYEVVARRQ